jgi:integrase
MDSGPRLDGGGMAGVKLTERLIERLDCPVGRKDRLVFDTEQRGLAVRVMAVGTKSYLAQYSRAGKKHRVPLGSVDAISLAMARDAARAIMGRVAIGENPAVERKVLAEASKAAGLRERVTLRRLLDDWTRLHLAHRSANYRQEATRALAKAFEDWLPRSAERLDKAAVVAALDRLSPSMARAVAGYGRACFAWAQKRGLLPANPFLDLPVPPANVKRDRVLTDAEAAKVWKAAATTPAPYGPIVQLLMLTGQRRDEVGGMRWEELAPDLAAWTVPAERTKNGVPSIVPLPEPARAILAGRERSRRGGGAGGLVFPGEGGRPFGNWSKSKAALDRASGVTGWRLHDLRRTVATGLQRLGVRLEVTEAVLNHVSGTRGGIVGIYQRHDWRQEKRAALDSWAAHLLAIAADEQPAEKVVPMRWATKAVSS